MVEDHNKAVKLFQQEERSGHHTELKQFAPKDLADARGPPEDGARAVAQALADRCPINRRAAAISIYKAEPADLLERRTDLGPVCR